MTFANSSTITAVSTSGSELLLVNAMTGSLSRQATTPSIVTHLEFSHNILLTGSADGYVRAYDPRTGIVRNGGSESMVKAHYGGIQGLQTAGNFIFTIGMSLRYVFLQSCLSCFHWFAVNPALFPIPLSKYTTSVTCARFLRSRLQLVLHSSMSSQTVPLLSPSPPMMAISASWTLQTLEDLRTSSHRYCLVLICSQ